MQIAYQHYHSTATVVNTIESIDSIPRMYISYPIIEEHNIQTYEAVNINNTDMTENGENASPGTRTSPSTRISYKNLLQLQNSPRE